MAFPGELTAVAELLQAPVATSVSGKGRDGEAHPLAVGWGFGPHASEVAEKVFAGEMKHPLKTGVSTLLAVGVKFSEVSTGYYGNPQPARVIHVDANACNLGRVLRTDAAFMPTPASFWADFLRVVTRCADPPTTPWWPGSGS